MGHFLGRISRLWFANVISEISIRHQMEMSGIFFHFTGFDFLLLLLLLLFLLLFFFFSLYRAVFIHVPLLSVWWSAGAQRSSEKKCGEAVSVKVIQKGLEVQFHRLGSQFSRKPHNLFIDAKVT